MSRRPTRISLRGRDHHRHFAIWHSSPTLRGAPPVTPRHTPTGISARGAPLQFWHSEMWHRQLNRHEERIIRDFQQDERLQERAVALCAGGKRRGLILSGQPGIGKTTRTRRVLEHLGASYGSAGARLTGARLFEELFRYRRCGFVADDCDDGLRDFRVVNLWKHATELPPSRRKLIWSTKAPPMRVDPAEFEMTDEELRCCDLDNEGRAIIRSFHYDGWVVIITNLYLPDLHRQKPHIGLQALLDRVTHLPQRHWDVDSMMLRIEWLCAEHGMITAMGLGLEEEREVLEFLRANRRRFPSFTLRTAEKVAEARRDLPDIWREFVLADTAANTNRAPAQPA
jgi:hypothetical protein